MLYSALKVFVHENVVRAAAAATLILQIFVWIYSIVKIAPVQGALILHTNAQFGVDFIGGKYLFFFMPLIGLIFGLLNFCAAFFLFIKERPIAILLMLATVLIQIIITVAALTLSSLNV